jgi:hypothetical protein
MRVSVFFVLASLLSGGADAALSVSTAIVLNQGRRSMCASSAFDASGRPFVVIGGGVNADNSVSDELIVYDALRESKTVLKLSVPRYDCVACFVDDVVLIAGGCTNYTAPNSECRTVIVESYNVSSRAQATLSGGLSEGRTYMAAAQTRTHCAFVAGARTTSFNASSAVDAFDFRTRQWTYLNLSESRYYPAAVGVDDTVVVMGSDIGSGPDVRFTVEEIDFSAMRPVSRIVRNFSSSVYENTGARAGDWVIFAGGRRRDKNGTLLMPAAEVREPSGLWREIAFAAPDWMQEDAPFSMEGGSIGTQALFALGADSFLGSTGTPYVFLWNPDDIAKPSKGWNTRTWNLNVTASALAAFEYNGTGFAFVAGGSYNFSQSLNAIQLLKFVNEPGLQPTCAQCPPPSTCIGDDRCICDPSHLREGRFGCKLPPGATAAPTPAPTPFPPTTTTLTETTSTSASTVASMTGAPPPSGSSILGPAIGGAIAGVVVIGLLIGGIVFYRRRNRKYIPSPDEMYTANGGGGGNAAAGTKNPYGQLQVQPYTSQPYTGSTTGLDYGHSEVTQSNTAYTEILPGSSSNGSLPSNGSVAPMRTFSSSNLTTQQQMYSHLPSSDLAHERANYGEKAAW